MTQGHLLGGRYQVAELLGYGGMAEVHHGRDLRLGRDVAIKTLRHDLARDATFQLRFRREAQNAAALNHPAIVAVYDTGEERGQHGEALPYIIMEYVNGRTLKEVLGAEGPLVPRRAMELVAEICSALDFSHRHGIIHRDIKPGNVMLNQANQVKVMDFGIARALASGTSTMTQTSAVIGTAQYLSPEQAKGEPVDARSDVYATGCVLFELLCGQPPFVGDNPVSVAYQHVRESPRPPSNDNPDVQPSLDAIVLKALAKNPVNRYQSAGEMRGDLMRALTGRPVSAPPVLTEEQMTALLPPQPQVGRQGALPAGRGGNSNGRPQGRQRQNTVLVTVGLALLSVLALTAVIIGLNMERNKNVPVPTITGLTVAEANDALRKNNLKPSFHSNVTVDNCTVGKIADQDPKPGLKIPKGSNVSYDLCTGPNKVKVPALVGLSRSDAEQTLKDRKLTAEFQEIDSNLAAGTVISTSPEANVSVNEGSQVTVKVSKGNQKAIPEVVGLSQEKATAQLHNSGFYDIQTTFQYTNVASEFGTVLSQTPTGNTLSSTNTQITLVIGKATPTSSAPSSISPSTSSPMPSTSTSNNP